MSGQHKSGAVENGGFLVFLALVSLVLLYIVWPFVAPLLWATLAAIMFQPMYQWFRARLGGSNRAAIATLLVITVAIIIPAFFIGGVVVEQATAVVLAFREGRIDIAGLFETVFAADALDPAVAGVAVLICLILAFKIQGN